MTRIKPGALFDIVADFEGVIQTPSAVGITQKRFCSRVHSTSGCIGSCKENCGDYIGRAFNKLINHHNPYNPEGLLTTLLREETCRHTEDKSKERRNTPKMSNPVIDEMLQGLGT